MWLYKGEEVNSIDQMPEGTFGFIYEVIHKPSGRKYLGKKVLYFERNKRLSQKSINELRIERKAKGIGGRVPLKQKVVSESDWMKYYGSHVEIKQLIKEGKQDEFDREILQYVPSKKLLTYYECKHLFINEVLENENYINDNVLAKFYRKDFIL
jgi:serine/threonine protein kinase